MLVEVMKKPNRLYRDPQLHTPAHCRDCSTVSATAITLIVWSCHLKGCFASASAVKGACEKTFWPYHPYEAQEGRNRCPWLPLLG